MSYSQTFLGHAPLPHPMRDGNPTINLSHRLLPHCMRDSNPTINLSHLASVATNVTSRLGIRCQPLYSLRVDQQMYTSTQYGRSLHCKASPRFTYLPNYLTFVARCRYHLPLHSHSADCRPIKVNMLDNSLAADSRVEPRGAGFPMSTPLRPVELSLVVTPV